MKRFSTILAASLFLLCAAALPALAQGYGDNTTTGVLDSTIGPGDDVTITGDGFLPDSEVSLTIGGTLVASATVAQDTTFAATFSAPDDAGTYTVVISGLDEANNPITLQEVITVVVPAAAPAPPTGGLAFTGLDLALGLAVVLGLFGLGATAIYLGRRRSATA